MADSRPISPATAARGADGQPIPPTSAARGARDATRSNASASAARRAGDGAALGAREEGARGAGGYARITFAGFGAALFLFFVSKVRVLSIFESYFFSNNQSTK